LAPQFGVDVEVVGAVEVGVVVLAQAAVSQDFVGDRVTVGAWGVPRHRPCATRAVRAPGRDDPDVSGPASLLPGQQLISSNGVNGQADGQSGDRGDRAVGHLAGHPPQPLQ
jgi:hypothetical protein